MKTKIKFIALAFIAFLSLLLSPIANGATWNNSSGIGDGAGNGYFTASGVSLAVIQSVQSNSVYTLHGGAQALGAARIQNVTLRPDLVTGTLNFYVPTNQWTCASNQPAGTNIIWLTSTNSGLATNDLLVLAHADGTMQLLVLSGNATDAGGLVFTNSAGYNGVKVFTTPTNTITAGDIVHKLALRQSITPLTLQNYTNDVAAPWGNLWGLNTRRNAKEYYGDVGKPCALVLTFSNSAALFVDGDFKRREN